MTAPLAKPINTYQFCLHHHAINMPQSPQDIPFSDGSVDRNDIMFKESFGEKPASFSFPKAQDANKKLSDEKKFSEKQ
jgi:hypothetical protein